MKLDFAPAEKIYSEICTGKKFVESIAELKYFFPKLYIASIQASEKSSSINQIIHGLNLYYEKEIKLFEKLRSALFYPSLILFFAITVLISFFIFILPKFETMFESFGEHNTLLIKNAIKSFKNQALLFSVLILLLILSLYIIRKYAVYKKDFNLKLHNFVLRIPLLKNFILAKELYKFSFLMEKLSESFISLETALLFSAEAFNNIYLKEKILNIILQLEKGNQISFAFEQTEIFPDYFMGWINVGSETGNIQTSFKEIKKHYENETNNFLDKISLLTEPAAMILVGVILLNIVIKLIVPIFNIYGNLGNLT